LINENTTVTALGHEWRKSSYSNPSGSCVEVSMAPDAVLVRDSKDRPVGHPVIGIPAQGWATFVKSVTTG
jgi:hypothetical protein